MRKLICGIVATLVLLVTAVTGITAVGDKSDVVYGNKRAYHVASVSDQNGKVTDEIWVLRDGDEEGWKQIEFMFRQNVFYLRVLVRNVEGTVVERKVMCLGFLCRDYGWQWSKKSMDEAVKMIIGYSPIGTIDFDTYTLTEFKDGHSKKFIDHLVWAMAKADYDEGQKGN